jgi:DNA-binding IclR family transcriptional regulator
MELREAVSERELVEQMISLSNQVIRWLDKDLEKIREMGYAVSFGELTPGAAGLAAPIKNHFGEVIASLGFAGPANRFSSRDLVELTTVLIESADKISTMLGYINKDEVIFFNNLPERSSES